MTAFCDGVAIGGLCFKEAQTYQDGGRRWLIRSIYQNRGEDVALRVDAGGIQCSED